MLNVLKLYEKNNLLAQFTPEPDRVYTFGSSREANCADARLAPCQLRFVFTGGNWHVEDASGDGSSLIGGAPFFRHPVLASLDVELKGHQFRLSAAGSFVGAREQQIQQQISRRLLEQLNKRELQQQQLSARQLEDYTVRVLDDICGSMSGELAEWDSEVLREFKETLVHDLLKLGPLEPLLSDDLITEIMVVDENRIYVEKNGRISLSGYQFKSVDHLMRIIERIVTPLGRRIDTSSPMVDARLADGSRVNAIIPPLAADGPCLTIRKFGKKVFNCDMLLKYGSLTPEMVGFIRACVMARKNIVVSGGTGSGKTSLLNAVSAFIGHSERIITVEDSLELKLQQPHVIRLEARPPNAEGQGAVPIRQLVINCLRMRPDRIVVGECRGGEALDMLQAMNTGHDGSLTTVHANSAADAVSRLETLVLMSGMDLPLVAIRSQIASAVDVIIQTARQSDGSRKIISITEVLGLDGNGCPDLREIFRFRLTGLEPETHKVLGVFEPVAVPSFLPQLKLAGIPVEDAWFRGKEAK